MKNIKKIAAILSMFLFCIMSLSAQTERMKFMGIPIAGSPIQMGEKLKAKGFVFKEKISNHIREYSGTFAGSNVVVDVVSTSNVVWKILVEYPEASSFSRLESDYEDMVGQFKKKYGEPTEHFEFFSKPYYKGDGYEMQALRLDKCNYASYWEKENGTICVEMSKGGHLWIGYEDKVGVREKNQKENQQIQDDI